MSGTRRTLGLVTSRLSTLSGGAPHAHRGKAFTLVELLVVVAIIIVLVAILLPALEDAMAHAELAKCGANQKGIGTATSLYLEDNRRYYTGHHENNYDWVVWPSRLRVYAGGANLIFTCPSAGKLCVWESQVDPMPNPAAMNYGYKKDEAPLKSNSRFSYGINDWGVREFSTPHLGMGGWVGHPTWGEFRASDVKMPQDMIYIGDSTDDNIWDSAIDCADGGPEKVKARHRKNQYASILFADVHVSAMLSNEVNDSYDPSVRVRWNNDHQPHLEGGY